jgi:hypothetical protein
VPPLKFNVRDEPEIVPVNASVFESMLRPVVSNELSVRFPEVECPFTVHVIRAAEEPS